jgi:serine/threonine-protein kinase
MLAIGPHASGEPYGTLEQHQLVMLAAQVGLLLERAKGGGHLGRYRIERRLGIGGMAEVHLAWQIGPGGFERRVALKQPLPHITEDPTLLAAFLDEARLASSMQHPCIAAILEIGRDGNSYFMAMEYIDGLSLRALLRAFKHEAVPLPRALAVMDSLLRALEAAHRATDAHGAPLRLVHRDVTPANVMVSTDGDIKLVDFGIALAASRLQITRAGTVKGTAAYMSPEQRAGRDVDHRSDVFGAGLLLYELLAGYRPWPDGAPVAAPPMIPPAPVPDAVMAVITRALAWPPGDRFASAEAMRTALLDACRPVAPAEHADLAQWVIAGRQQLDAPAPLIPTATTTATADSVSHG